MMPVSQRFGRYGIFWVTCLFSYFYTTLHLSTAFSLAYLLPSSVRCSCGGLRDVSNNPHNVPDADLPLTQMEVIVLRVSDSDECRNDVSNGCKGRSIRIAA